MRTMTHPYRTAPALAYVVLGLLWPLGVLVACVDAIAWWWEDT